MFLPRSSHKVLLSGRALGEHSSLQQTTTGCRDVASWRLSPLCCGASGSGQHSKHPCEGTGNLLQTCSYQSPQENQEWILRRVSLFNIPTKVLSTGTKASQRRFQTLALLQPRLWHLVLQTWKRR